MSKHSEEIERRLGTPTPRVPPVPPSDLLSTGCTLLNMAFSGRPDGGVPKGTYLYIVGDSGAMKTWMTFCLFAEAARNPEFAKYAFVHDNAENGALMDVAGYFGPGVVPRLRSPRKGAAGSSTVQEFYLNVEANVRRGPCIYVLDSMDALQDDADEEKFEAEFRRYQTGKGEVPGSMGMAKARTNSKHIARIANKTLRTNGSILVVVSQTRSKVGSHIPGLRTRAGGDALRFYAHLEVWTKVKGVVTRHHNRKDREVGSYIQADVQKNRLCGWEGKVPLITFLKGYGVDDLGSCVDYLLDERYWRKIKKKDADSDDEGEEATGAFAAPEFDFEGKKESLIKKIQDDGDEAVLHNLTARVWREIEAGARPVRRPRYT